MWKWLPISYKPMENYNPTPALHLSAHRFGFLAHNFAIVFDSHSSHTT